MQQDGVGIECINESKHLTYKYDTQHTDLNKSHSSSFVQPTSLARIACSVTAISFSTGVHLHFEKKSSLSEDNSTSRDKQRPSREAEPSCSNDSTPLISNGPS